MPTDGRAHPGLDGPEAARPVEAAVFSAPYCSLLRQPVADAFAAGFLTYEVNDDWGSDPATACAAVRLSVRS